MLYFSGFTLIFIFWEKRVINCANSFNKAIIGIIRTRRFYNTFPVNSASFVFEFFHGNIKKIALKSIRFLSFFYINILVGHKEYWKMIRSNFYFKFGCCNRIHENMIYSFLSNACWFVYDWYHALAKHNINKVFSC